jgi:hypothetical protein
MKIELSPIPQAYTLKCDNVNLTYEQNCIIFRYVLHAITTYCTNNESMMNIHRQKDKLRWIDMKCMFSQFNSVIRNLFEHLI